MMKSMECMGCEGFLSSQGLLCEFKHIDDSIPFCKALPGTANLVEQA